MTKLFIELETTYDIDADYTDQIIFLDERDYTKNLYDNIKRMIKMNHNNDIIVQDIDEAILEYINDNYQDYITDYIESFYPINYKIEDLSTYDKVELSKYIIENYLDIEEIEALCTSFNILLGKVGYSQWTYVLCAYDSDLSLASDLWDGYNFYDFVAYDSQGDVIDSLCMCYCPNTQDIDEVIDDYFKTDDSDIYIIKNCNTEYYNGMYKLANKITNVSYNFMIND